MSVLKEVDIDRKAQQEHLAAVCERGIEACRRGDWKAGLVDLAWLVQGKQAKDLPGLCYSYLGYGVARYDKRVDRGVKLCKHALRKEWYQPENYLNMARTCLLDPKYRREGFEAIRDGLKVDPDHPGLLALQREHGVRRPPVLGFLGRSHPFNRLLGSLRAVFTKPVSGEGNGDEGKSSAAA